MNPVRAVTLKGIKAKEVEVEVDVAGGLFSISIVGLPDASVKESRERVRAALSKLGVRLRGRISINLAPADLQKEGALMDLPIALGIAEKLGYVELKRPSLFMGELALDGRVRKVRGVVSAALLARDLNIPIYIPMENCVEAGLVKGVEAYGVSNLEELFRHIRGETEIKKVQIRPLVTDPKLVVSPDLSDIRGQVQAKRALEVAAAGHHNILLIGAPGSGKTMLAKALRGILPPLSDEELLETLAVRSSIGLDSPSRYPPFRTVHHTASTVSVCGGGTTLQPGEISLAHRGVLFLDEFTEFKRDLLEALRQPLEDGSIVVSRASGTVVYPSRVLLILAANPCACGWRGDPVEACRCSHSELERYRRKLSGPIMDRIDIQVSVPRLTSEELIGLSDGPARESSSEVARRVGRARKIQRSRWLPYGFSCNAEVPEKLMRKNMNLSKEARSYLVKIARGLRLSGRGFGRALRVARTISDLAEKEDVDISSMAEALTYRDGSIS